MGRKSPHYSDAFTLESIVKGQADALGWTMSQRWDYSGGQEIKDGKTIQVANRLCSREFGLGWAEQLPGAAIERPFPNGSGS
jgi:hypothetical protein